MKVPVIGNLFRPRTDAARHELERFKGRYEAHLRDIDLIALSVLIWGPGMASESPVLQKRKQIRQELLDRGFVALFSEDVDEGFPATTAIASLRSREHAQAQAAHLVIILVEDSAGALAEAEAFSSDPDIAWKVFILAPTKYRQGFSGQGTFRLLEEGYGGMYWYENAELIECNVLSQALIRAQARREIYALHRSSRGIQP